MKCVLFVISAILTCQFAQAQIAGADKTSGAFRAGANSFEDTIIRIEHQWAEALEKRDLSAWSRCLARDWIGTGPDGTMITKAGAYADLKAGLVIRELFRLDDLKVRIYGDTAIVFGLETEKSKIHGKDMSGQYRFTDVFVKRDGRGQAVASSLTRISARK